MFWCAVNKDHIEKVKHIYIYIFTHYFLHLESMLDINTEQLLTNQNKQLIVIQTWVVFFNISSTLPETSPFSHSYRQWRPWHRIYLTYIFITKWFTLIYRNTYTCWVHTDTDRRIPNEVHTALWRKSDLRVVTIRQSSLHSADIIPADHVRSW